MSRAAYMREYRKRRKAPPHVTFLDVPVIDGVATLPDGRTVASTSQVVRVPIAHNLPKPEPWVEPEDRIAELEAEVARLKRKLAARPERTVVFEGNQGRPFVSYNPVPKPGK